MHKLIGLDQFFVVIFESLFPHFHCRSKLFAWGRLIEPCFPSEHLALLNGRQLPGQIRQDDTYRWNKQLHQNFVRGLVFSEKVQGNIY